MKKIIILCFALGAFHTLGAQETLNITFAMLTFVVFSVVLFIYNKVVFAIFLLGSILYGGWMALFLRQIGRAHV